MCRGGRPAPQRGGRLFFQCWRVESSCVVGVVPSPLMPLTPPAAQGLAESLTTCIRSSATQRWQKVVVPHQRASNLGPRVHHMRTLTTRPPPHTLLDTPKQITGTGTHGGERVRRMRDEEEDEQDVRRRAKQ